MPSLVADRFPARLDLSPTDSESTDQAVDRKPIEYCLYGDVCVDWKMVQEYSEAIE